MNQFKYVEYPEPHIARTKEILQKHPELKKLFGNTPTTAFFIFGIVIAQICIAYFLKDSSFLPILLIAFFVGATFCHALWTLIHECTHNLVFKSSFSNLIMQIIANLPICYPAAISFRVYHLIHHRYQGTIGKDTDLAIPLEIKIAGKNPIGKALWLFTFVLYQPLRAAKIQANMWSVWTVLNIIVQTLFCYLVIHFWGGTAFAYLILSSVLAVGSHPFGARWIQEHYTVHGNDQETTSYYGPLNLVAFNVGYHNEHHDLMMVPWSKLPKVREIAPEFYENLYHHKSWTGLLLRFLFDSKITLNNRIVRKLN